jgi:Holliday junction resolvase RusA-like endonuclease
VCESRFEKPAAIPSEKIGSIIGSDFELLFYFCFGNVFTYGASSNQEGKGEDEKSKTLDPERRENIRKTAKCSVYNDGEDRARDLKLEEAISAFKGKYSEFGFIIIFHKKGRSCDIDNVPKIVIDAFSGEEKLGTPKEFCLYDNDTYIKVPWLFCCGTKATNEEQKTEVFVYGKKAQSGQVAS